MTIERSYLDASTSSASLKIKASSKSIETRVLRKPEVIKLTGLSNTSIFNRTGNGTFPTPISLGGRSVGYFEHEVMALLTALSAGRTEDEIKSLVTLMIEKRKEQADAFLASLVA